MYAKKKKYRRKEKKKRERNAERNNQWRSPNNVNCDVIFLNALQNALQNAP